MTIKNKLLAAFFGTSLFCVGVGSISLAQMQDMKTGIRSLAEGTIPALGHLRSVSQEMYAIKVAIRSLTNERGIEDDAYYSRQLANIEKARARYKESLAAYNALDKTSEERRLYESAQKHLESAANFNDTVLGLAREARTASGLDRERLFDGMYDLISGDRRLAFDNFTTALDELIAYDQDYYAVRLPSGVMRAADTARLIVVISTFASFLIALCLGWLFGRNIADSVMKVSSVLGKVAVGDLSDRFETRGNDEFKKLSEALSTVISALTDLSRETGALTQLVTEGKLTSRGNVDRFNGSYRQVLEGVNGIMDALAGFIDNMPAPAMIVDTEFNVVFMNRAAAGLGGTDPAGVLARKTKCRDFFKTGDCSSERCACFRAMKEGTPFTSETVAKPLDRNYDISYTGVPVRDRSGKIVGALEIITDQTDIRAAERLTAKVSEYQNAEISRLQDFLHVASGGDFSGSFEVSIGDEETRDAKAKLERIAEGLNATIESISDTLAHVNETVEQVSAGSEQVAQASQALSQGATEQASSLEELTASVTEIAGQTKMNADYAVKVDEVSRTSKKGAESGNESMKELIAAMSEINANAEKIRNVIQVIDDIAFQINLLALNANVEAARAGKFGKGFAVVAEEVRNLAVRSAQSVKETTGMIEATIESIGRGNTLVGTTARQLATILEGTDEVAGLAGLVSDASKEQSAGLTQVSVGLGQIDQVTQSNTASAEECAAAAEELSSQAQTLKGMVTRFRLRSARDFDRNAPIAGANTRADQFENRLRRASNIRV